jgi:hypothetical protein
VNNIACDKNDRPKNPPKILRTEILFPPFDDIVPRVQKPQIEQAPAKEKTVGVKYVW